METKIPTPEEILEQESYYAVLSGDEYEIAKIMKDYLNLHKKAIRYEYDQYQFFLDGYSKGSASMAEVREAHDRFLKLLE